MPIRMKKDDYASNNHPNTDGEGNICGGGIGKGALGFLLPLLFLGLIIFGGWYLFKTGRNSGIPGSSKQSESLSLGCKMKPNEYEKAFVFAAPSDRENLLENVSLEKNCPSPKNQVQQGRCAVLGNAYAAKTVIEAIATGKNPIEIAFSPSFLYNQISLPNCQGAYINKAMKVQQKKGAVPFKNFDAAPNKDAAIAFIKINFL